MWANSIDLLSDCLLDIISHFLQTSGISFAPARTSFRLNQFFLEPVRFTAFRWRWWGGIFFLIFFFILLFQLSIKFIFGVVVVISGALTRSSIIITFLVIIVICPLKVIIVWIVIRVGVLALANPSGQIFITFVLIPLLFLVFVSVLFALLEGLLQGSLFLSLLLLHLFRFCQSLS